MNQLHKALLKKKKTVATAESCTGGLLSYLLTQTSGSSEYFLTGIVAYSNKAKNKLLHIPLPLIKRYGAVSKIIAIRMAQSIRKIANTDFGISTTGIAGPTGGSKEKPVGTVFIAVASAKKIICKKCLFKGNRAQVRKAAVFKALSLLYQLVTRSS